MISLLSYLHTCFMRSYRYGPATFVFFMGIIFVYSVVPNPVMASYAFSTTFIFIISAVLCYALIDMETTNQESVTVLHCGSLVKLYLAKLLYCWLFTIPLALYAISFPAIFQKFDRNPTVEELVMALLYHMVSSWLGVALACWFSSKFIRSRVMSFLMLSVLIVITLSVKGIENVLPEGFKPMTFLLPPLSSTIDTLVNYNAQSLFKKCWVTVVALGYGVITTGLFVFMIHRRKLDSMH
ncbi:hypothetical protein M3629_03105 [Paenibacillus polysaccharolyticus]|uniref:hypothetical protein n=1 Tax=Paenibacillus polysaccharolyticus TaxID=582692 RepID=UPI00203B7661|nr:hypothetical protein [Paenibacillus polysaccharolyticus]MCM3131753.1 hypothetical protein [Paenibacillus polysaccharolyticus]